MLELSWAAHKDDGILRNLWLMQTMKRKYPNSRILNLTKFVRCRALRKIASPTDKLPEKAAIELQIALLGNLGWKHWQRAEESRLKDAFPPKFRPF